MSVLEQLHMKYMADMSQFVLLSTDMKVRDYNIHIPLCGCNNALLQM